MVDTLSKILKFQLMSEIEAYCKLVWTDNRMMKMLLWLQVLIADQEWLWIFLKIETSQNFLS